MLGLGGGEGVEGELASVVGAELEEQAGAAGVVGVNGVDEAHPGGAVEVAFVGDGGERGLELARGKTLRDDGDAYRGANGSDERGRVDEGGQAAVAEGVAGDLLVGEGERSGSRWGSGVVRGGGVRARGVCG